VETGRDRTRLLSGRCGGILDRNYISHCKLDVDIGAHSHQPPDFPAYGEEHRVATVIHTDLLPAGEYVAGKVGPEGVGQGRQIPRGQSGTRLDPLGLDRERANLELTHRDQEVPDLNLITGNGAFKAALNSVERHVAGLNLGEGRATVHEIAEARVSGTGVRGVHVNAASEGQVVRGHVDNGESHGFLWFGEWSGESVLRGTGHGFWVC